MTTATFDRSTAAGDVRIAYEELGSGFPILLLAPGGMRSAISFWAHSPWNPIEQLAGTYRVIAMDQRNAGASTGPVTAADGWHTYAEDQLALLDHLGVNRFHIAGQCIGGPYAIGLALAAPERVASAVLFQPIGLDGNRQAFFDMFDSWADELRPQRPDVPAAAWASFRQNMYGTDFLFNCTREDVRSCRTPLLVLRGDDLYHPASTSEEIAALAPDAELVERWKEPEDQPDARKRVEEFLAAHTPT